MSALDIAKDLLASIPLTAIAQQKAELLKTQIETMESRMKLMEDRVKFAEEKSSRLEAENASLRSEASALREQVAMAGLTEEYEHRPPFVFKKGDPTPRCPSCKGIVSQNGNFYKCTGCPWSHTVPVQRGASGGSMNMPGGRTRR